LVNSRQIDYCLTDQKLKFGGRVGRDRSSATGLQRHRIEMGVQVEKGVHDLCQTFILNVIREVVHENVSEEPQNLCQILNLLKICASLHWDLRPFTRQEICPCNLSGQSCRTLASALVCL
jgi:hypothetical protein